MKTGYAAKRKSEMMEMTDERQLSVKVARSWNMTHELEP